MNPNDTTAIERFVRSTLGCQCPDEVFRHVEVGPLPLPNVQERAVGSWSETGC